MKPFISIAIIIALASPIIASAQVSASSAATQPLNVPPALQNDAALNSCQALHPSRLSEQFTCVYAARDFLAAEFLGQQIASHADNATLYMIANAFATRGNAIQALIYGKFAYSRLRASDKTNCARNTCGDLRALLQRLDPSYRAKFAAEDKSIASVRDAQARQAAAAARQRAADAAEAAREAARTALDIDGKGIHTTENFTVNSEWQLDWSYDCSDFADGKGNFQVYIEGDAQDLAGVNQLGSSDSGTEYYHEGGTIHLVINSECLWTVKAINE